MKNLKKVGYFTNFFSLFYIHIFYFWIKTILIYTARIYQNSFDWILLSNFINIFLKLPPVHYLSTFRYYILMFQHYISTLKHYVSMLKQPFNIEASPLNIETLYFNFELLFSNVETLYFNIKTLPFNIETLTLIFKILLFKVKALSHYSSKFNNNTFFRSKNEFRSRNCLFWAL